MADIGKCVEQMNVKEAFDVNPVIASNNVNLALVASISAF